MKIDQLIHSIDAIVRHDGNGAREALTEIEPLDHPAEICWADWILLELAARGYQVMKFEEREAAVWVE